MCLDVIHDVSTVRGQQSLVFFLIQVNCMFTSAHLLLKNYFLGMIIEHPSSKEEVSCLKEVFQWLFLFGGAFFLMALCNGQYNCGK